MLKILYTRKITPTIIDIFLGNIKVIFPKPNFTYLPIDLKMPFKEKNPLGSVLLIGPLLQYANKLKSKTLKSDEYKTASSALINLPTSGS